MTEQGTPRFGLLAHTFGVLFDDLTKVFKAAFAEDLTLIFDEQQFDTNVYATPHLSRAVRFAPRKESIRCVEINPNKSESRLEFI